jgi:hypothetical protein
MVRVLVLVIASRGPAYDAMRRAWGRHAPPAGWRVAWLYGDGCDSPRLPGDFVAAGVRESLVPGALDKTVAALRELLSDDPLEYDYVLRTNLSSWFHWRLLAEHLAECPRARFCAGYSPDGTHLSGCGLLMSRDVAARLAAADLDRGLVDDLAWSAWLARTPDIQVEWTPRIDLVYDAAVLLHPTPAAAARAWQVRLKHHDRALDAALLELLVAGYDPGAGSLSQCELAWAAATGDVQINFAGAGTDGRTADDRFGGLGRL